MNTPTVRLEKARAWLKQKGLSGLVIFSDGTLSILGPSHVLYWAGYRPLKAPNIALFTASGKSVLLAQPAWDAPRIKAQTWIPDVRPSRDMAGDLAAALDELGIAGTIGLAGGKNMTIELYRVIESKGRLEPADALFESLASEKGPAEIDIARRVGLIADVGFQAFHHHARPGIREYELAAEVEYAMRSAGADDNFILMGSEHHNFEMHEPGDRRLEKGDIVIGEITPVLEGQFLQLCRTVYIGRPSPLLQEKYDLLVKALQASMAEVKAGAPAGNISKTMNQVLSDAGYGKYCYPPYMRARGHGFGIGSIAPGGVIDDNTVSPLLAGQVVVVHPNQYIPETGYLACGETVIVTTEGYERLSVTETILYGQEA